MTNDNDNAEGTNDETDAKRRGRQLYDDIDWMRDADDTDTDDTKVEINIPMRDETGNDTDTNVEKNKHGFDRERDE